MASNREKRKKRWPPLAVLALCAVLPVSLVAVERPAFAEGAGATGDGGGRGGPGSDPGKAPGHGSGDGSGGAHGGGAAGAGAQTGAASETATGAGAAGGGQHGHASQGGTHARRGRPDTGGGGPEATREFVGLFASQQTVEFARQLGLEVEQRSLPTLGLVISRFRAASPDEALAAQSRLNAAVPRGSALFAPNSVYRPMAEPCGDGGCSATGLRRAVRLSSACRQPRSIGIVDTEVERSHPALRSSTISTARFLPTATAAPADDGHGTAIAALLVGDPGSRFPGIVPSARLYAANAFSLGPDDDVRASAFNLAEALEWLATMRSSVINLSLAGPPNLLLQAALARTVDRGTVVVAAAGNGGPAAPPAYPAAYDGVIAVTAVDDEQRPYLWANQGDYVQFAAPGVDIPTADIGGAGRQRSGTSLAAALFSGLVAGASPPQARRVGEVEAWARLHAVDLGPSGRDPVFGWGVIEIGAPCGD